MNPGRWEAIQAAFDAVIELDAPGRATKLASLGSTDPELRATVEALLAADAEVDTRLASLEAPFLSLAPAPDVLGLAGRTVSHFRVLEPLGAGGMGVVYRAEDMRLGRAVALKFLLPHFGVADTAKSRFLREARSAAALDHPNLCTVYEVGESEDGRLFLAMALHGGETLKDRLDREGALPAELAARIAQQIAEGLGCAHAAGIVHRDLKPGNLMVLPDGMVKILDFGLARARDESQSGTSGRWGTAPYMAPEQVLGEAVDARTDLWALGVVLYEMVTGRRPFGEGHEPGLAHAILAEEPVPPSKLAANVPAQLEHVILTLLEKEPSRRFRDVSAVLAALFTPGRPRVRLTRRRVQRLALVGVGAAVIGGLSVSVVRLRGGADAALDPNLVAVAPFDVFDPKLELWREGLVDVLSRNLDGAGPLRTVSPTVVVRRWEGRADPASATDLGRRTGARLVLFGQLLPAKGDSVRLKATLYDVARGSPVDEVEVRDLEANMDHATNSLAVALLGALARTRPLGAVRLGSLGSTALPAIKLYLRAQQFYRVASDDSAIAYAHQALAIDSNFAMAFRLISLATAGPRAIGTPYRLMAGARNHGLAPRESLLVVADSLWGALDNGADAPSPLLGRLFGTLETAVRLYPSDPEVWFQRGEVGFHGATPYAVPLTVAQTFEYFQRAIQLDSAFIPAYGHAVELAQPLRGRQAAHDLLAAELSNASLQALSNHRLLRALLDARAANAAEANRMIDTSPRWAQQAVWLSVRMWTDSDEVALRLARLVAAPHRSVDAYDSWDLGWILPLTLAYRGHLHEALETRWGTRGELSFFAPLLLESAILGLVPHDSATTVFRGWLKSSNPWAGPAAAWWALTGDTTSIWDLARRADSLGRFSVRPMDYLDRPDRWYWQYVVATTRPYLALARHDTGAAIAGFASLPDSLCPRCFFEPFVLAQLLVASGRDQEAAVLLNRELYPPDRMEAPSRGIWALLRGRVQERLGNKEEAIAAYRFVADLWIHADPELQRYVAEAHEGLRRLGAERSVSPP
jgi:serine/threonine-protein kinase